MIIVRRVGDNVTYLVTGCGMRRISWEEYQSGSPTRIFRAQRYRKTVRPAWRPSRPGQITAPMTCGRRAAYESS